MSLFSFRLQSVLDYRQTLADRVQQEYTRLLEEQAMATARLESLRCAEQRAMTELGEQQRHVVNMARVLQLIDHQTVLSVQINDQQMTVERLTEEASQLQQQLI